MKYASFARPRAVIIALMLASAALCSGCGGYAIHGRVVQSEGAGGIIDFVSPDDPRLNDPGIVGATISVHRDPERPSAYQAASGTSDGSGRFTIPLDEFGAGWMEEVWMIRARHRTSGDAETILHLPGGGQGMVLLIVLSEVPPGAIRERGRDEDYMKDYEKFR